MRRKKKYVKLCGFLLILVMLMAACGGKNNDSNSPGTATDEKNKTTTDDKKDDVAAEDTSKQESKTPKKSKLRIDPHKVPGKNIYIDVPNYQEIERGYTRLFIVHDQKYVAVTANKKGDASSLTAAHASAFDKFKQSIQDDSYVNSLNITKESTETINGIEFYKYEGTLNCGHDTIYDAYTAGFSFVLDGVACNVTGSVVDQEQPEEMIEEIRSVVEAMIPTVRSEK